MCVGGIDTSSGKYGTLGCMGNVIKITKGEGGGVVYIHDAMDMLSEAKRSGAKGREQRGQRRRSEASKEIEMVCRWTPLLAGDWERRGIGTRGDTLGGACVCDRRRYVCVCVWCVFLHTHWYVRMLFVCTVWHI